MDPMCEKGRSCDKELAKLIYYLHSLVSCIYSFQPSIIIMMTSYQNYESQNDLFQRHRGKRRHQLCFSPCILTSSNEAYKTIFPSLHQWIWGPLHMQNEVCFCLSKQEKWGYVHSEVFYFYFF